VSQSASPRRRTLLVTLLVLAVVAVIGVVVWQLGGDDEAEPLATSVDPTTSAPTTASPSTSTSTPTPEKTKKVECEGPDTQFNVEGVRQDSLLPDCGTQPVTQAEQDKKGLGLACGGSYPVILYKTTTSGAKTSICGKDASGVEFRLVTKPTGGETVDVKGQYDPDTDAFVAKKDGTSYAVQAYDGTLLVSKDGRTTTQKSSDWISLDNESDYD
jgi:hypothetical protein